jgi:RNA polymerase sigma-70 factor (ECF subfamily)
MTEDRVTELYRTYGSVIYAHCRRLLGESTGAEDATQETFMRVHRHLDKAPDSREALTWIYRIATHYCLNEQRNRKIRPVPCMELPEVPAGNVELLITDRDLAARIVRRAPEKLAVVAWLHYVDGMEQEEVARVLGLSRRTVVNHLRTFIENAQKFLRRETS